MRVEQRGFSVGLRVSGLQKVREEEGADFAKGFRSTVTMTSMGHSVQCVHAWAARGERRPVMDCHVRSGCTWASGGKWSE